MSTFTQADFPYIHTPNSLVLNHKGVTRTIKSDDPRFDKALLCIKEWRWDDLPALMNPAAQIKVYSNGKMEVRDGIVFINTYQVPTSLNRRIISHMENNEPFEVLVNFFEKLLKNPSFRAVNELFDFLEANHFPLNHDGRFVAYKGVTNDYKDIHTGTFDNSIFKEVKVERNQVDEDCKVTCSNGLHVAAYSYAHNFSNGRKIVEVLVDPADVVAVPIDYANAKMRVCKYVVIGDSVGERTENVYKSKDVYTKYNEEKSEDDCEKCYGSNGSNGGDCDYCRT